MTSPTSQGEVSVEILADAKKLAKSMKAEVEKAFKDLDPGKATEKAGKKSPVKVPLQPDADGLPEKVKEETKKTKVPRVPVGLDPLLEEFQAQARRQLRTLAKTINAEIPVSADTDGLRRELAGELAEVARQAKAKIPVEVGDRQQLESDLRASLAALSERVRASVKVDADTTGVAAEVEAAVERANPQVDVDVNVDSKGALGRIKGLFQGLGSSGSGIAGLVGQFSDLGSAIQRSVGSSAQLGGSLVGAFVSATGPVGIVIGLLTVAAGAMGALAAAAVAAVPAIAAVAGAAAAIPGALAGAGAAFGALSLGFRGISEAFKSQPGGGGGGGGAAGQAKQIAAASRQVEAARRGIAAANRQVDASERALAAAHRGVAAAEERLADAQKRALQAQAAISKAREQAVEDIEDLNRSLRGAQLNEEEAALAVTDALRDLEQVRLSGNIPDIQRADLAYRQALQTLEDARDTTSDLSKETEEANRKGVDGSDAVQDAYREQEDALRGVRDAQIGIIEANDSLKSAQDGVAAAMDGVKSAADGLTSAQEALAQAQQGVASGGGGVARELIKLAPSAQRFVDAVKGLKPAFDGLRLDVQERLFKGLDRTVTNLGSEWIPRLRTILGQYATSFNTFFRDLGSSLTDREFMADLSIGLDGFRRGMDAVFTSVSQKLVPALGDLAEASAPFLEALGDEIANVVTQFSEWVQAGEKSGALKDFFAKATAALREIFGIGGAVGRIIGGIVETITGAQQTDPGKSPLEAFRKGLDRVADWLNNPKNQQQIRDLITDIGEAAVEFGKAASAVNEFLKKLGIGGEKEGGSVGADIGRAIISGLVAGLWAAYKSFLSVLYSPFTWFLDNVKLYFGIRSPSTVFAQIGRDIIQGLLNGISGMFSALRTRAGEIRTNILNGARGATDWLRGTGNGTIGGLMAGMGSKFGDLRSKTGEIRGQIQSSTRRSDTWLVASGKAVMDGLIFGIGSKIGQLGAQLVGVTRFIKNNKGPIEKDRVMLTPAGEAIMDGLIAGIGSRKGALGAELADVSNMIALKALPQVSDAGMALGLDATAAISRNLSVADQRQMLLGWRTGTTGDQLLDAIARHIDVTYNSDVQAALTRTGRPF